MNKDDLILIIIIPSPFYRLYRFAKWALSIPLMIAKPFLTVILIPITHFSQDVLLLADRLYEPGHPRISCGPDGPLPDPLQRYVSRNGSETLLIILAMGSGENDARTIHTTRTEVWTIIASTFERAFRSVRTLLSILIQCLLKSLLVPSNNS